MVRPLDRIRVATQKMGHDAHASSVHVISRKDNVMSAVSMTRISGYPLLSVINLDDNLVV